MFGRHEPTLHICGLTASHRPVLVRPLVRRMDGDAHTRRRAAAHRTSAHRLAAQGVAETRIHPSWRAARHAELISRGPGASAVCQTVLFASLAAAHQSGTASYRTRSSSSQPTWVSRYRARASASASSRRRRRRRRSTHIYRIRSSIPPACSMTPSTATERRCTSRLSFGPISQRRGAAKGRSTFTPARSTTSSSSSKRATRDKPRLPGRPELEHPSRRAGQRFSPDVRTCRRDLQLAYERAKLSSWRARRKVGVPDDVE